MLRSFRQVGSVLVANRNCMLPRRSRHRRLKWKDRNALGLENGGINVDPHRVVTGHGLN